LARENVAVVGLSVDAGGLTDGNRAKVREFARHYKVPYALGFPEAGSMIAMQDQTIPTTVLVDREGRVAKTYVGALTAGVLEEDVRAVAQGR
jgi:cytochrome c biogenesis protein CcmG/thiol:disulfide interchange protein DsbE